MKRGLHIAAAAAIAAAMSAPAAASASNVPVTTTEDLVAEDDLCSLREAVDATNLDAPQGAGGSGPDCPAGEASAEDVIALPAGTYSLTGSPEENDNGTGDLDLELGTAGLEIRGAGRDVTAIDAGEVDRAIESHSPIDGGGLTLDSVAVVNGEVGDTGSGVAAEGGGIYAWNDVSLVDSRVANNETLTWLDSGGGMYVVFGDVSLTDSAVVGNSSGAAGGGMQVSGSVTLSGDSHVDGNEAGTDPTNSWGDGGGIIMQNGNTLTLGPGTTVNENLAQGSGGGISLGGNYDDSRLLIHGAEVSGNTVAPDSASRAWGGGIEFADASGVVEMTGAEISGNSVEGTAGGGMYVWRADSIDLAGTTFADNSVGLLDDDLQEPSEYGGVYGGGGIVIRDAQPGGFDRMTLSDNTVTATEPLGTARFGGGGIAFVQGGNLMTDSVVSGNRVVTAAAADRAGGAGAMVANAGATLRATTIADNAITGPATDTRGGGVLALGASRTWHENVTFSGNSAAVGGGLAHLSTGQVQVTHATYTGNAAATASGIEVGPSPLAGSAFRGNLIDQGADGCNVLLPGRSGNVDGGTSCIGAGSRSDIDANLAPLGDNGGATPTHLLLGPEAAVDVEARSSCRDVVDNPLDLDQRGGFRVGDCDAGAVERIVCGGLPAWVGSEGADVIDLAAAGPVVSTGSGADEITGTAANERICPGPGDDMVDAGGGDDLVFGDLGNDDVDAGPGTDLIDFSAYGLQLRISLPAGTAEDTVFGDIDRLAGIENVTGGSDRDVISGDAAANVISSGDGGDTVTPGGGPDRVDAGPGQDEIFSTDGFPDVIDCGSDVDHSDEEPALDATSNCELANYKLVDEPVPPQPPKCRKGFKRVVKGGVYRCKKKPRKKRPRRTR